jgi:hypothetical protein
MTREDKNKRNNAVRASSNERDQGFTQGKKHPKSNRSKEQSGSEPSERQQPEIDADRNRTTPPAEELRSSPANERRFDLLVDSVPYMVHATPYKFNGEVRYRVSFNGGSEHVFTWDSSTGQLRAIDDEASTLPDNLEEAISEKLQSKA